MSERERCAGVIRRGCRRPCELDSLRARDSVIRAAAVLLDNTAMRKGRLSICSLLAVVLACGGCGPSGGIDDGGDGGNGGDGTTGGDGSDNGGPCQGLECEQVECQGGATTSISGTVYAPNGTLPLSNATVYVPNATVDPFPEGASCYQCGSALSGNPLVQTTTDTMGHFTLRDMPAASDVPLVIQVGKWRTQTTIREVRECEDTAVPPDQTRLPRNQDEGDIPLMAITTGGADALECLLRKIGLDDSEFTTESGGGRVQLYAGSRGSDLFDSQTAAGAGFSDATALWNQVDTLRTYDVVFLSCESSQFEDTKPEAARQAMKDYADLGGRVFASHWHNYWLEQGPRPWPDLLTFDFQDDLGDVEADINTDFDRGSDLADWLVNVGASTTRGVIDIVDTQHTVTAVDESLTDKWIFKQDTDNGTPSVQYMSFTTPIEDPEDQRCGRVVFSDIHVSTGDVGGDDDRGGLAFPSEACTTPVDTLTPQEKVLAFMIFDIASCVGPVVD
jgi:hypothetical protein